LIDKDDSGGDLPVDCFDFFGCVCCVIVDTALFFMDVDVVALRSGEEKEEYRLRPGVGCMPPPWRAVYKIAQC
jgi:hypothetical protein